MKPDRHMHFRATSEKVVGIQVIWRDIGKSGGLTSMTGE